MPLASRESLVAIVTLWRENVRWILALRLANKRRADILWSYEVVRQTEYLPERP